MNFYQRMGILPLKKCVNRDKCSFATKQRMFGVFAIDEILRYRWTRFVSSRTLCHPGARLSDYFALTKTRNGLGQLNITKVCSISQFVCHPRSQISGTWSQISSTQILLIADSWYHARPCLFPKNLIFKTANILIFNKFPSSAIEVPITGAAKKIIDVFPIFLLQ